VHASRGAAIGEVRVPSKYICSRAYRVTMMVLERNGFGVREQHYGVRG
jgi:hypothetical protein